MTIDGNAFSFLSTGQVFSRTFSIFFDQLDIYLTISALVHLPAIILTVLLVVAVSPVNTTASASHMEFISNHMFSVMLIIYMQAFLSMLVTIAGEGGMVRATADIYAGRSPEWYPSLREGLHKFLSLVGASLIVLLGAAGVCLATYVFFVIFMFGADSAIGVIFISIAVMGGVVGAIAVLGIFVSVVPLYPIIIIEEKGPVNALRRCMEVSKGRRAYMFVGVLLMFAMQIILGRLLHKVFNENDDPASFFFSPSGRIVSFLPNVLYVPLVTILKTVLYMSVRVDKEGLNQQVLQRELSEPVEYAPPVSDYRQVALVDDRQNPNIVPSMSDDDFA